MQWLVVCLSVFKGKPKLITLLKEECLTSVGSTESALKHFILAVILSGKSEKGFFHDKVRIS
jgi:hypothetical protein